MVFDDLPACVDISASAFIDDELYAMINPHRHEYPLAWRYWCSSRMRRRFVQKDTWGFVCFNTTSSGIEQITGYCLWCYTLEGAGSTLLDLDGNPKPDIADPPVEQNHDSIFFGVERLRARIESTYNEHPLSPYSNPAGKRAPLSLLSLRRSFGLAPSPSVLESLADPSNASGTSAMQSPSSAAPSFPAVPPTTPFAPLPPHFHLFHLAVSPDHQRLGIGRALLQHSLDGLIAPHHVPAVLIASPSGYPVYKAVGFKTIGWLSPPELNFEGGAAMVWDGSGEKWLRDVTEEDERKAGGKVKVAGRVVDAVYMEKRQ